MPLLVGWFSLPPAFTGRWRNGRNNEKGNFLGNFRRRIDNNLGRPNSNQPRGIHPVRRKDGAGLDSPVSAFDAMKRLQHGYLMVALKVALTLVGTMSGALCMSK